MLMVAHPVFLRNIDRDYKDLRGGSRLESILVEPKTRIHAGFPLG